MTGANNENDPTSSGTFPREGTTIDPYGLTLRLEPTMDLAVGLMLALERQRRGLTIEALAQVTGLPLKELKDHESGNYPLPVSRAALLSETLGFDPSVLLGAARLGQRHGMIAMTGRAPDESLRPPAEDTESHDSMTMTMTMTMTGTGGGTGVCPDS